MDSGADFDAARETVAHAEGRGVRIDVVGIRPIGFPGWGVGVTQKDAGYKGYLAHKKTPTPLGPSWDPRHRSTVGS